MNKMSTRKSSRSKAPPKFDLKKRRVDLRKVHQHGTRLLETLSTPGVGSSYAMITAKADVLKINAAELSKRVKFAKLYDNAALEELLKLDRIRWSHVRKLLTVADAKQRQRFAVAANKHGWSVHSLACEIEGQIRDREYGGRPPNPRPLSPGSLHEFKQESDQLLRLFNAFDPVGGKLSAKERRRCQVMLPDIISKLKELQDGLSGFIVKLKDACG